MTPLAPRKVASQSEWKCNSLVWDFFGDKTNEDTPNGDSTNGFILEVQKNGGILKSYHPIAQSIDRTTRGETQAFQNLDCVHHTVSSLQWLSALVIPIAAIETDASPSSQYCRDFPNTTIGLFYPDLPLQVQLPKNQEQNFNLIQLYTI